MYTWPFSSFVVQKLNGTVRPSPPEEVVISSLQPFEEKVYFNVPGGYNAEKCEALLREYFAQSNGNGKLSNLLVLLTGVTSDLKLPHLADRFVVEIGIDPTLNAGDDAMYAEIVSIDTYVPSSLETCSS